MPLFSYLFEKFQTDAVFPQCLFHICVFSNETCALGRLTWNKVFGPCSLAGLRGATGLRLLQKWMLDSSGLGVNNNPLGVCKTKNTPWCTAQGYTSMQHSPPLQPYTASTGSIFQRIQIHSMVSSSSPSSPASCLWITAHLIFLHMQIDVISVCLKRCTVIVYWNHAHAMCNIQNDTMCAPVPANTT